MDHLLERLDTLERHVRTLEQQNSSALRRLRWWRRFALVLMVLGVFSLPLSFGEAQPGRTLEGGKGRGPSFKAPEHKPKDDDDKQGKGLAQRVRALERTLEHVTSVLGPEGFPELVITGANLRIVNGLGITDCGISNEIPNCPNGVGNLIVGYNDPRHPLEGQDTRTGSHVVVVGRGHNYTRFGGVVVGRVNEISGDFASVLGSANVASGLAATVTGGNSNTASGVESSVTGGQVNVASGDFSWIGSGVFNTASGFRGSISGGLRNTASGAVSSISGGDSNTASEVAASVSGGQGNIASSSGSTVSGGQSNTAAGILSTVSGGSNRTAPGNFDWVAGSLFQDQ